ncbi:sigma 54-interacting transcriptional regulator [Enterococcus saccharolyticus]|uniref:sigma 54-interacting transcriptional regulator n=1 Tax=Enterococcus saccharolyticus TaxID=41997 RepID=UPI001E442A84|nr:sigma 54-interacting transcriptional regulator [Enterococcus saccharolyticus]MCD5001945.1 sigma 54-interacting transcriptional regulator [Enterococcus saccharolyticus]
MKEETYKKIMAILTQTTDGLTTLEISEKLGLSRSVTSLYLNQLFQNGQIYQTGNKPVYWLKNDNNQAEEIFSRFIGSNGSMKQEIEKCKAAILYPPLGLPVLLHGNSGVGKSFLARLIFDYLKERRETSTKYFYTLNCADYANNPELLSSMLFGHRKGAFTGADEERRGLLAQADGGVLFLDEVHRLSHENQEKLFQFMDTGEFRPVGEDEATEKAKVRLLFATTEEPAAVLLPTFYRRISVIVELLSFHERPLYERATLLKHLFWRETKRIHRPIRVSHAVFNELLEKEFTGNIGSLQNEVQLYCADALQKTKGELIIGDPSDQSIIITMDNNELNKLDTTQPMVQQLLELLTKEENLLTVQERLHQIAQLPFIEGVDLTQYPVSAKLFTIIQENNKRMLDNDALNGEALDAILRIQQFLTDAQTIPDVSNLYARLKKEYPRTTLLCGYLTAGITSELRPFIETLLSIALIGKISEEIRYPALLVAHGNTTASSIQGVANKLCEEYIFDAINMPLTSSVHDVIHQVKLWLSERDTTEGVIMLVDMGSLTQLYKSLKPQILGELLVVNNLTTSYALEIGQQLVGNYPFYEIAKLAETNFKTEVQYFEGFSVEKNILISSLSGRDVAKKIRSICEKYFYTDTKKIVLNFNELVNTLNRASEEENYLKETYLIVTTTYLDNHTKVPKLNLLDVVDEDAEEHLHQVLKNLMHPNNIPNFIQESIHFFSKEGLSEKLEFLNPDVIIRQVEDITEKCEKRFGLKLSSKMKFNLTMHLALMIERTILGGADYPLPEDIEALSINQKTFYQNIKSILYTLEKFYRIEISDWELYVLYEILIS